MIWIEKSENEPPLLKRFLKEIPKDEQKYAGLGSFPPDDEKKADDEIRAHLAEEQGFLCAYCMKRIDESLRIEHYIPQNYAENPDLGKELSVKFKNMLGVCTGEVFFHSDKKNEPHCEKVRGNKPLHISPMRKNHIDEIKYDRNGKIFSDNILFEGDLNETLNLNIDLLKRNRIEKWEGVKSAFERQKQGKKAWLEKELEKWKSKILVGDKHKYREYCGIVIYFLEKELQKAKKSENKFRSEQ